MEGLVDKVFNLRKKEYVYKRNRQGQLVTSLHRLAYTSHGSAVKTYRKNDEKKSKVPLAFWKI